MKQITNKYFIYCRKSSEDEQRQIASIGDQTESLRKLVEREDLDLVREFSEEKSAKDPGRPVFNEVLNRIEKGEADGLICWDIDRLSRNPIDNGRLQWMLQKGVIRVIKTPGRSYYPEDAGLLMSIEGGRATDFVMRLSKNVKRGLMGKVQKGWRPSGGPIGYINIGTEKGGKTIASDPERFLLVRKMWELFLAGNYSVSKIVDIANNEWGLRTLQRRKLGGKPLALSHGYKIFSDPFYYGYFNWTDPQTGEEKLYKGSHEAMISESEFWRAQTLLGKKGKRRPSVRDFAFTGMMSCGECGSSITAEEKHQIICSCCKHKFSYEKVTACPKCKLDISEMTNPKILDYTYYRCSKKKGMCSQKYIELSKLEEQFQDELKRITIDKDYLDIALDYLQQKQKGFGQEESLKRVSLERALDDCQTRLKNLHREYTSNQNINYVIYAPAEFIELKNEIVKERESIKQEMEKVVQNLDSSLEATEKTFNFCHFALHHFNTGTVQKKREIFSTISSNIVLKDKKINISKFSPFLIIENGILEQMSILDPLEPKKSLSSKGQKRLSSQKISAWLPG